VDLVWHLEPRLAEGVRQHIPGKFVDVMMAPSNLSRAMFRVFVFALALGALTSGSAFAQAKRERSPKQIADSTEIARLARSLTSGAATDSARASRIYEWVARNISYDVKGFLQGRLADGKPEDVYRKRVAVCGGYVGLFERLAHEAELDVVPVLGYAKGFTYRFGDSTKRENHAWLAVRIANQWRLVDPTWGSGVVAGGKFEPRFTWDYFLVDPNELVLSHFPVEERWQLLTEPMRRGEFERLPMVHRSLFNAGFDASTIRTTALASRVKTFPIVGSRRDVRIVAAPLSGTLKRKSTVSIEIVWPGAREVALVSGGVWSKLTREGDRFRGEAVATEKDVALVGRTPGSKDYETLLYYQVQ
jgi:hypothetical protein